jgi:cytochrome c oxidase subunit 3
MQKPPQKEPLLKNTTGLFVHLLLAGIIILFLGLSYGYIFSMNGESWVSFKLPKIFWLSTLNILCVSYFLQNCIGYYDDDKARRLKFFITLSLIFALIFICCQLLGWNYLYENKITLEDSPSAGYLYVITGIHALHVVAGIIFLLVSVVRINAVTSDEIKSLIYFSDPVKRVRLKLLVNYWHTIDFLWLFLFSVFLFKHA